MVQSPRGSRFATLTKTYQFWAKGEASGESGRDKRMRSVALGLSVGGFGPIGFLGLHCWRTLYLVRKVKYGVLGLRDMVRERPAFPMRYGVICIRYGYGHQSWWLETYRLPWSCLVDNASFRVASGAASLAV